MTNEDYLLMIDTIAVACRPLDAKIDKLEAENRSLRERLTLVERKVLSDPKNHQHADPEETIELPSDWWRERGMPGRPQ